MTIPVIESALFRRVRKALNSHGADLRGCREDARWFNDLGRCFSIDVAHNAVLDKHIDLEVLRRELQVVGSHESLAV